VETFLRAFLNSRLGDILLTGLVAGTGSGFLSNGLASIRTKRQAKQRVLLRRLNDVYFPIYKLLVRKVDPSEGYLGIDRDQGVGIMSVVLAQHLYVDPQLERLVGALEENIRYPEPALRSDWLFDEDRELLTYVLRQYHTLKMQLGMPYDDSMVSGDGNVQPSGLARGFLFAGTMIRKLWSRQADQFKRRQD